VAPKKSGLRRCSGNSTWFVLFSLLPTGAFNKIYALFSINPWTQKKTGPVAPACLRRIGICRQRGFNMLRADYAAIAVPSVVCVFIWLC
jgi:hypothetical protein